MKKFTPGIHKAVKRLQEGTTAKTVRKVDACVLYIESTGDYQLLLIRGIEVLQFLPITQQQAKETCAKLKIGIGVRRDGKMRSLFPEE